MSFLDGASSQEVLEFGGAKPLLDPSDLQIGDAALANNCEFFPRRVQPRRGFTTAFSPNRVVQSMKYWAQGQSGTPNQYLVYLHDHSTLTLRNINTNVETDILTSLTDNSIAVIAPSGARLYAAILSSAGFGSHPGFVWDGNLSHTMDNAFQRPMLTTEVSIALSQPSTGVITAGAHSVGVIFQTRSGYLTRPGPAANTTALTLTPATITASGSNNLQAVVTPTTTWPTWIKAVQIVYTTAANNFQYYLVPGTLTTVTPGSATPATITWNIADLQLRSLGAQGAGSDATEFFDLLSMDNSNNPPFNVKFVVAWGSRIVWFGNFGGIDSFFPSDPSNPESITADQHILQLPGGLPIISAFVLRGILYVCSPIGGIFAYLDNGGRPVTWSPAQAVEASVSVQAPLGVTVDDSGSGYAVLAAQQGMFIFPGVAMPDIPLSYYSGPDWDLIDWTQFTAIEIKIHQQDRLFMVLAKQTTGNTRIYTYNYLNGRTPEKIKYSTWYLPASYSLGCFEIVLSPTKNVWEVWIGPSTASVNNTVLRQMSNKGGDASNLLYADTSGQILQVAGTVTASGATSATTAGINTTGATLLVITVSGSAAIGTATVSDSFGNSWHPRADATVSGLHGGIWYAFDKSGAALATGIGHTVTVSLATVGITFSAFSGTLANHVDPYDSTAGESTGANANGTTVQPGSITPISGSLVVTAFTYEGTTSASSVSAPYTIGGSVSSVSGVNEGSAIGFTSNVTGATNPTWTANATTILVASIASFKAQVVDGIDWQYITAPLPEIKSASMRNHIAIRLRALNLQNGNSNLYIQVLSLDGTNLVTPPGTPLLISNIQDRHNLVPYDFTNEVALYKFHNNIVAQNAPTITWFEHFSTLLASHR